MQPGLVDQVARSLLRVRRLELSRFADAFAVVAALVPLLVVIVRMVFPVGEATASLGWTIALSVVAILWLIARRLPEAALISFLARRFISVVRDQRLEVLATSAYPARIDEHIAKHHPSWYVAGLGAAVHARLAQS